MALFGRFQTVISGNNVRTKIKYQKLSERRQSDSNEKINWENYKNYNSVLVLLKKENLLPSGRLWLIILKSAVCKASISKLRSTLRYGKNRIRILAENITSF